VLTLARLITDNARWAPEYQGGLSNHLPMALVALQRLGADDARLQAFADRYAKRLEPAPPHSPWAAGDAWPGRLGDVTAYAAYASLFNEWVAFEGGVETLAQTLPQLMPGCGAAAFHGMIRVAHAALSGHLPELADALAYWAARHLSLGPLPEAAGQLTDAESLLRRLRAGRSKKRLIAGRMRDAARDPTLHAVVAELAIDAGTLEQLSRLAARAYAASGNFTALHLVTACHAMHVLLRFVDDEAGALRWFWQAYATAVVAAGLQPQPAPRPRAWPDLVDAALGSDDEHCIKLVHSCRELERAHGGPEWQLAAARACG